MAPTHKIVLTAAAKRDLHSLPRNILRRVDAKILALAQNPRSKDAKKLRDRDGLCRVRVGDYRILYLVDEKQLLVLVVRVGHRRDVYR